MAEPAPQEVGVLLVHGIGEQRRFEHLNGQGRQIMRAIKRQPGLSISIDIAEAGSAAYYAEHEGWCSGRHAAVRMAVARDGHVTHHLHFHEMWWADVNEGNSITKQLRFWLWGLSVWAYPVGRGQALTGAGQMASPVVPPARSGGAHPRARAAWMRVRLFMVGVFFAVLAFPVGLLTFLLQRLLNARVPDILRVLASYLSGVKLFLQSTRFGRTALGFSNEDLLDTLDEPPRVSVRRRMIRAIAAMAGAGYHRWYIVAHSQGTVASFNGLMESANAWPGYFDEAGWRDLCAAGLAGPATAPLPPGPTLPQRPVWARADEIAYRARIFARFAGLLTLGSPLEKFAAIWPGRVPINRAPTFAETTAWVNVFDPIDPVSGVLDAFRAQSPAQCPRPLDVGYTSHPVLLQAHLTYLAWRGPGCLADGVAHWLLTGAPDGMLTGPGRYGPDSAQGEQRRLAAHAEWVAAFLLLLATGGAAGHLLRASLAPGAATRLLAHGTFGAWIGGIFGIAAAATLLAGALARWTLFGGRDAPEAPGTDLAPAPSLEPAPAGQSPLQVSV